MAGERPLPLRAEDSREAPPPPGDLQVATPPASDRPTTAMLKADIDSGATGDKVAAYDPGLSQLGTDDEAAGNAPSAGWIGLARRTESAPARVRHAARQHGPNAWVLRAYAGVLAVIGLAVALGLWFGR